MYLLQLFSHVQNHTSWPSLITCTIKMIDSLLQTISWFTLRVHCNTFGNPLTNYQFENPKEKCRKPTIKFWGSRAEGQESWPRAQGRTPTINGRGPNIKCRGPRAKHQTLSLRVESQWSRVEDQGTWVRSMFEINPFWFRLMVQCKTEWLIVDPAQPCTQFCTNTLTATYPCRIFVHDSPPSLTIMHFWLLH